MITRSRFAGPPCRAGLVASGIVGVLSSTGLARLSSHAPTSPLCRWIPPRFHGPAFAASDAAPHYRRPIAGQETVLQRRGPDASDEGSGARSGIQLARTGNRGQTRSRSVCRHGSLGFRGPEPRRRGGDVRRAALSDRRPHPPDRRVTRSGRSNAGRAGKRLHLDPARFAPQGSALGRIRLATLGFVQ